MAKPRLTQPQHTVLIFWSMPDQYSQRISPVLAFKAKTSSFPVMTYMMPSLTSGVASKEYLPASPEPLRRVIQAPLSCLTLEVLICFRVEYRWLVTSPPLVSQSFPGDCLSRRSKSGSTAQTETVVKNNTSTSQARGNRPSAPVVFILGLPCRVGLESTMFGDRK